MSVRGKPKSASIYLSCRLSPSRSSILQSTHTPPPLFWPNRDDMFHGPVGQHIQWVQRVDTHFTVQPWLAVCAERKPILSDCCRRLGARVVCYWYHASLFAYLWMYSADSSDSDRHQLTADKFVLPHLCACVWGWLFECAPFEDAGWTSCSITDASPPWLFSCPLLIKSGRTEILNRLTICPFAFFYRQPCDIRISPFFWSVS